MKKIIPFFILIIALALTSCQKQKTTICPSCKESVFYGKYCIECGHSLSGEIESISDETEPLEPDPIGTEGLEYVLLPDGTYAVSEGNAVNIKNIIIPSKYDGKKVTAIGDHGFKFSKLISITIPNSVTTIGDCAFEQCSGLENITIPDSVTTIGEKAFYSCGLTEITIPGSVISMGKSAFHDCRKLTSVTINVGVVEIGDSAFYDCRGLTNVTMYQGAVITTIGKNAFYGCMELSKIHIPNTVTTIENGAFYYCSDLKNIYYDGSVAQWNEIDKTSFYYTSYPTATVICSDGKISLK